MNEISDSSESDAFKEREKKRYKLPLNAGYKSYQVTARTRKNWENKTKKHCNTEVGQNVLNNNSSNTINEKSTNCVPNNELVQCKEDLRTFVKNYEKLYGTEAMTFNLHTLLHVVQSVKKTGPLIFNSAWSFEHNIYNLKQCVCGPHNMDKQIAHKNLKCQIFKLRITKHYTQSADVIQFCENLYVPKRLKYHYEYDDSEKVTYCGKKILKYFEGLGHCFVYKRCIYQSTMYHSINYEKSKRTDNSIIKFRNRNIFYRINDIIDCNGKCYFNVHQINTFEELPFKHVEHIFIVKNDKKKYFIIGNN